MSEAKRRDAGGGELSRLADLLRLPATGLDPPHRRLARVWEPALGREVALNSQPRFLRAGRLTVATSSAVWAQSLQLLSANLIPRLNAALGEELVQELIFRPAGWDPGGGAGSPRALGGQPRLDEEEALAAPKRSRPSSRGRQLSREEQRAVEEVAELACDEDLGQRIAAAMRAALTRGPASLPGESGAD